MRSTPRFITSLALSVAILLTGFTHPLASRKLLADRQASTVSYAMKHAIHKWDAVSHDVNCAINYSDDTKQIESVAVSIKVSSFDSGNGNRDSHGMEVMEGLKYPNVTFVSQDIKADAAGTLLIKGTLTFHGIAKPVTITATRSDAAGKLTVAGTFAVSLTAHNVERPSFLGIKTDDTVNMTVNVVFPL